MWKQYLIMNHRMKGIEAAITIVILLLVAVAIVGLAYAFITGFFTTITGNAGYVGGSSFCNSAGVVTIVVTNGGTAALPSTAVTIVRQSCTGGTCVAAGTPTATGTWPVPIGSTGTYTINCGTGGSACGFGVTIAGVTYNTVANC